LVICDFLTVFFLASPDADFITGQTIDIDGGKRMLQWYREWPIREQPREYSRRSLVRNAILSARWFVLAGELKTLVSQLIKVFLDLQGARGGLVAFDDTLKPCTGALEASPVENSLTYVVGQAAQDAIPRRVVDDPDRGRAKHSLADIIALQCPLSHCHEVPGMSALEIHVSLLLRNRGSSASASKRRAQILSSRGVQGSSRSAES
jgi:hypothetical protein